MVMSQATPRARGCFGLGLMAVGLTIFAVGLLLWGGANLAENDPGPTIVAVTVAGGAAFVLGVAVEVREWIAYRRAR